MDVGYGGYVIVTVTREPPKTDAAGFMTNPVGVTEKGAVAVFNPSRTARMQAPDSVFGMEYETVLSLADWVEMDVLFTYTVKVPVASRPPMVAVSVCPGAKVDGAKADTVGA